MIKVEEFYIEWVKNGNNETPFLHDDAMEFSQAYVLCLFNRCDEPQCPKCGSNSIKLEWMLNGNIFDIFCSCGFSLTSERVESLADFRQFFPSAGERAVAGSGTPSQNPCLNHDGSPNIACKVCYPSSETPTTPSTPQLRPQVPEWDYESQHEREKAIIALQEKREQAAIVAAVAAEREQWQNWGIIELAVRNTNVASYVEHWEDRALKAETELASLKAAGEGWAIAALKQIADDYKGCHCTHEDDNCCARISEPCPHCTAEVALARRASAIPAKPAERPAAKESK